MSSTRIGKMSKRRKKIAWRRFLAAEIKKSLKILLKDQSIHYNKDGLSLVKKVISETLSKYQQPEYFIIELLK